MSSDVSSTLSFPFNQGRSIQIIYLCHKKEPLLIKNSQSTKGQHFIAINHRLPFHIHNIWIRRKIENVRNMSFEPYDKKTNSCSRDNLHQLLKASYNRTIYISSPQRRKHFFAKLKLKLNRRDTNLYCMPFKAYTRSNCVFFSCYVWTSCVPYDSWILNVYLLTCRNYIVFSKHCLRYIKFNCSKPNSWTNWTQKI